MITPSNLRARSFELGHVDLFWDLGPTYDDLNDFDVYVLRSEAEFGPYEVLTPAMRGAERYRDSLLSGYHSRYTRLYYRVRVVERISGNTAEFPSSGGTSLSATPDLIAIEMARQESIKLQEFSGRRVWVYPRRKTGQRCPVCYDRVTGRQMRADCINCYGTTWVGGYHPPIAVYAQIQSSMDVTVRTPTSVHEVQDTLLKLSNYPELDNKDLIVELENKRWVVGDRINKIQKGRATIRQEAPISLVPSGDIEYRVPVNFTQEQLGDMIASPERNYTNPQTLESASLDMAMRTLFGKL